MRIELLADRPELIEPVGLMRWREWGVPPEPTDESYWIDTTRDECGREGLPVSWVAIGDDDEAIGVVAIGEFDLDFRDRSPWVWGMVVHPDNRRNGIGAALIDTLLAYATGLGYREVWVATGGPGAPEFYQSCGFEPVTTAPREGQDDAFILVRRLA